MIVGWQAALSYHFRKSAGPRTGACGASSLRHPPSPLRLFADRSGEMLSRGLQKRRPYIQASAMQPKNSNTWAAVIRYKLLQANPRTHLIAVIPTASTSGDTGEPAQYMSYRNAQTRGLSTRVPL